MTNKDVLAVTHGELMLKDVLMRKPRYVPNEIATKIPTLQIVFDDCLLVVGIETTTKIPYALLLQNEAVTTTYRILFEMSWRGAIKN